MGALGLLLLVTVGAAEGPCFTPSDGTPGWKRVALPEGAPHLAAPEGVAQFRSGERAQVVEAAPDAYRGTTDVGRGKLALHFAVPPGATHLQLDFLEPLHGMKVDATVSTPGRALPLLRERRVGGNSLALAWELPDAERVTVTLHYHLRTPPVLHRWHVQRDARPAEVGALPAAFRQPHALYYLQPEGRPLVLCQAPARRLAVDVRALRPEQVPDAVTLVPR
jgi:hypothetical protein